MAARYKHQVRHTYTRSYTWMHDCMMNNVWFYAMRTKVKIN